MVTYLIDKIKYLGNEEFNIIKNITYKLLM